MKKKSIIMVLALALTILIGYIGLNYYNSHRVKEDVELKNEIIKVVQSSEEVDFSKVTNFEWNELYLFTPYTNSKEVLKQDGVKGYDSKLNMEYNDGINIIAFVNSKKITTYVAISRLDFDFESIENYKISKDKAIFKIDNDDGDFILSLKK